MNKPTDFQIRNGVLERYTGTSASVVIPEGVRTLRPFSFFSTGSVIKSITFPKSLSYISRNDFACCTELEEILVDDDNEYFTSIDGVLFEKGRKLKLCFFPAGRAGAYSVPDGVTEIAAYAFYGCKKLTALTLPNSLSIIGGDFLRECSAIQSITVPRSVTVISEYCFLSCSSLNEIHVDGNNEHFASIDGVLYDKSIKKLISCPGNKRGSLEIPETVTTIGAHAFHYCRNLTEITIPDSVLSIGTGAFVHCESLKSATIPGTVQKIIRYTFSGCTALSDITIANGVKEIENDAFAGCSQLSLLTVPESVTVMPPKAFEGDIYYENRPLNLIPSQHSKKRALLGFVQYCTDETAPDIRDSYVKYFKLQRNKQFFEDLTVNLKLLQFALDNGAMTYELAKKLLEAVPEGQHTEIRVLLIDYLNKENEKTDPFERMEKELNKDPFSAKEMKKEWIYTDDGNGGIILKAYKGKETSIYCPNRIGRRCVSAIGCDCFSTMAERISAANRELRKTIKKITVPEGITEIGDGAFFMCSELEYVKLPDSITEIGEYAFRGCINLKSVNIPAGIKTLGSVLFYS